MISENLAQLFSNLSRDNVSYFSENWSIIIKNKDIKEKILSYCLEEKSFKTFQFAIDQGLNNLRSIIFANAIRSNNKEVIDLIIDNKLFNYEDNKATDLFSISVNNNDLKVVNFLLDKVKISDDILLFALHSQSKELLIKFMDMGFTWKYILPEQNPLVFIMENYKNDKADYIHLILKNSTLMIDKLEHDSKLYFEDTPNYSIINGILTSAPP